ncbi:hypothetical protein RRG08_038125 [Elysia crispata]|uniref:Uncharacterized protein n=1 Tax=Elysia crispata TaxID=231223 RepID=A0AAE0ZY87_9GAST|nr:hypothetical protein RRG08_038125 [Elysia crispata]
MLHTQQVPLLQADIRASEHDLRCIVPGTILAWRVRKRIKYHLESQEWATFHEFFSSWHQGHIDYLHKPLASAYN